MIRSHQKARVSKAVVLGALLLGATMSFVQAQDSLALPPGAPARPPGAVRSSEEQASLRIRNKLGGILVPRIEFRATTLSTAVEFLRQESARLDPEPGPEASRGVNFILKLPPVSTAAAAPASGTPADGASVATVSPVPTPNTRITLSLSRVPLMEALKYLATQAGLKIKVEPYAVLLVPLTDDTDTMVTKVFRVPPDMIGNIATVGGGTMLDQPATAAH